MAGDGRDKPWLSDWLDKSSRHHTEQRKACRGCVFLSNCIALADRNRVPVASADAFGMVRYQDDDDASARATTTTVLITLHSLCSVVW